MDTTSINQVNTNGGNSIDGGVQAGRDFIGGNLEVTNNFNYFSEDSAKTLEEGIDANSESQPINQPEEEINKSPTCRFQIRKLVFRFFAFKIIMPLMVVFMLNGLWVEPININISIIYAPETHDYVDFAIRKFNESYKNRTDPFTDKKLASYIPSITVEGKEGISGTIKDRIVDAINNDSCENIPTIYSPSVSHWLKLVNHETNEEIFTLENSLATAGAPVVIAIWEDRLEAIQEKFNLKKHEIGWDELLKILKVGWEQEDPIGRKDVFYVHTNPERSSTGLSTLLAEYYASKRAVLNNQDSTNILTETLTYGDVNKGKIIANVNNIENSIRHYALSTTKLTENIQNGCTRYFDFAALEENDFRKIAKTDIGLVALYPEEGIYVHEHPFAIPNHICVKPREQSAARVFTEFVRSNPEVRKEIEKYQFRLPVPGGEFIISENLTTTHDNIKSYIPSPLPAVSPEVMIDIQNNWDTVRKEVSIFILVDTFVEPEHLKKAKKTIKDLIDKIAENEVERGSEIGIISLDNKHSEELSSGQEHLENLKKIVDKLKTSETRAFYDTVELAVTEMEGSSDGKIKIIILLIGGDDEVCNLGEDKCWEALDQVLESNMDSSNPVIIYPIMYEKEEIQDEEPIYKQRLESIINLHCTDIYYMDEDEEEIIKEISEIF